MRKFLFIAIVPTLVLSCKSHKQQHDVPKALDEQKGSYSLVSKRSYEDIIESLYSELADQTPALKKLEDDIDALNSSKDDSLEVFKKFDSKNQNYYSSAQTHIGIIQDSLLQEKIKTLIQSSLSNYSSLTSSHNSILKSITSRETRLSDLHVVLKIIKTLPVITKYQKSNLPNTKSLEGYSKELANTINEAEKLSN